MTSTICLWPIVAALSKALLFLQLPVAPAQFTPVLEIQNEFIYTYFAKGYDKLNAFDDQELRSWASTDANELNAILKKEGFAIELEQFGQDGFGVVSILDVLVKWLEKGKKSTIDADGKQYDAVKMHEGFIVYSSPHHPYPLLCVSTKSGDQVWMTIADEPLPGFRLLEKINDIKKDIQLVHYDDVKFPMIDYDQENDISWLLGLKLLSTYRISQARQQTKFKMNEEGAHVKSAVALGFEKCCIRQISKHLVIDKPFYLWIERPTVVFDQQIKRVAPNLPFPILAGYFDTDCWKNPGTLSL